MSNEPVVRRLLPQSAQMGPDLGSFSFAPPPVNQQPRESQKNYVFVDEHNRHKRLKVMRACEGCRKRKIKCDAATTNTWPCSACVRLKLHCVRPNGYDGAAEPQIYEPPRAHYEASHLHDGFRQELPLHTQQQILAGAPKTASLYPAHSYADNPHMYHAVQYAESPTVSESMHYTAVPPHVDPIDHNYSPQHSFPTPPMRQGRQESPDDYTQDYAQLADLLGSLKVDEAGTAPYLNNKMRTKTPAEEEPAVEDVDDYKSMLPPLASGPGLKIRIPPALMPDEESIMAYFQLYFASAHQYVPVLDRAQFYHQWQTNRDSISPLLLEAIFAVAGRLADEPAQGQQWLAMATRHADSFMDVPRLSTLQALLILLKAREQAPKRGYYYRSWMSIVQCVQMGKDLGLDEHYFEHQAGRSCGSSPAECRLKTRIWQCIFMCEVMIGSPQARTDLQVELESVDFSVPAPMACSDETEYHVSRNFTYLARIVRNIGRMNEAYGRLRRRKEWGLDPEFVRIEPELNGWLADLPDDMVVSYPPDGSAPWVASAFIGNMHSYYYLSVILFHRPQLALMDPGAADGQWKHHMLLSYNAAKLLCRLQEAVLQSYHLPGLQVMQRGINFTIYAVLSCIVLHLVALTSPDPELSSDAREYFTRHMRILETCMAAWPMEDMQTQVDSVREAFSADTRKPFVLKPSFPYGSPPITLHTSPPGPPMSLPQHTPLRTMTGRTGSVDPHGDPPGFGYASHPITPPVSAGPGDSKHNSPGMHANLAMMTSSQATLPGLTAQTLPLAEPHSAWNPSRIFDQWNTTFGAPEIPTLQDIQAAQAQLPANAPTIPFSTPPVPTFVTPSMWQESVASAFEGGLKRSWDYDGAHGHGMGNKR